MSIASEVRYVSNDDDVAHRIRVHAGMASTAVAAAVRPGLNVEHARWRRAVARRVACRAARNDPTAASSSSSDDDETASSSFSRYDETSGAVKTLVSGLTNIVNAFGVGPDVNDAERGMTRKQRREARALPSVARDPARLASDISKEFTEAKYLWTGDIDPEMYDLFATFCDPTLAFVGLDTFERNLKNLQPVLRRVVRDSDIELYSCELAVDAPNEVRAAWRMTGNLNVPWRPRIDLKGRTTFTFKNYGIDRGCLIVAYKEEWELSAAEAVGQLLRPFQW